MFKNRHRTVRIGGWLAVLAVTVGIVGGAAQFLAQAPVGKSKLQRDWEGLYAASWDNAFGPNDQALKNVADPTLSALENALTPTDWGTVQAYELYLREIEKYRESGTEFAFIASGRKDYKNNVYAYRRARGNQEPELEAFAPPADIQVFSFSKNAWNTSAPLPPDYQSPQQIAYLHAQLRQIPDAKPDRSSKLEDQLLLKQNVTDDDVRAFLSTAEAVQLLEGSVEKRLQTTLDLREEIARKAPPPPEPKPQKKTQADLQQALDAMNAVLQNKPKFGTDAVFPDYADVIAHLPTIQGAAMDLSPQERDLLGKTLTMKFVPSTYSDTGIRSLPGEKNDLFYVIFDYAIDQQTLTKLLKEVAAKQKIALDTPPKALATPQQVRAAIIKMNIALQDSPAFFLDKTTTDFDGVLASLPTFQATVLKIGINFRGICKNKCHIFILDKNGRSEITTFGTGPAQSIYAQIPYTASEADITTLLNTMIDKANTAFGA